MCEEDVAVNQSAYCRIDVARASEDGREGFRGNRNVKQ
jgi:hypothetical protein